MNRRRIYYLCSLLVTFLFLSCQEKDTFEWSAGLSGPKHYGSSGPFVEFFYQGKSVGGASIGNGADLGWTITSSSYSGGKKIKPVPDSIFVNWVCASDRYEYEGGCKLPRKQMIALFKKDVMDPFGLVRYGKITTGMAPGGNVTVWLQGGQASTEICKFKVVNKGVWKENDPDYNKYIKEHREVSEGFKESNIFHYLHGIPYNIWETGEKKYAYDIVFSSEEKYDYDMIFYTKDGSWFELNDTNSFLPWGSDMVVNNKKVRVKHQYKLPVEFHLQWYSKDEKEWFSGNIVLPQNLLSMFLKKKCDKLLITIKNNTGKNAVDGNIYLVNNSSSDKIMTFQLEKYDGKTKRTYPYYSLPKGFVFPKWEGREALTKPTDFEYWQEK
ncbi:DUF2931 family protein [Flavobacterium hercynium]|uniref:DUF2931 domain-containing protein n=1 Tax=Flavobacterium hercynium TaxID=387094 RepID=A0A226GN56_9FLAO|nr:DUF2931 family protein [Flavobacterium hercynium]OXA83094.1 hypothetical protein B0A66_22580 [Flavobacterium hercynium]SMP29865.1 Protein of unknown function [Flavobacterium hercynium]